jgi:hypothetical protein
LDFSYCEFDMPSFAAVLEGCWNFHKKFKADHGFGPRGYGIYFVNRGYTPDNPTTKTVAGQTAGQKAAGAVDQVLGVVQQQQGKRSAAAAAAAAQGMLSKPYGNYSQWGPGVSFMMDPITDDADSPLVRGCGLRGQ